MVKISNHAGGTLLASVAADPDEATRYYALDHLGTPRLVTNACKAMVAQHAYYPFGMEATSSSQDAEGMKFTGQERDLMGTPAQTDDLDNMHARSFNPNILRFLSADSLRGDPHRPQSFNLFAYVQGNPSNFVDPFGLAPSPCKPGTNPQDLTCNGMPNDPAPDQLPRYADSVAVWEKYFKALEKLPDPHEVPLGLTGSPAGTSGGQQPGTQQQKQEKQEKQQKRENPNQPCVSQSGQSPDVLGLGTYHDVTYPVELLAANGAIFVTAEVQLYGAVAVAVGGCADPTPFELVTCGAGLFGGGHLLAGSWITAKFGIEFFKNITWPAMKNWGC